jgi:hypothetical protein
VIYYRAMKTCEKAEAKLQILHLVLNAGRWLGVRFTAEG